MGNEQNEPDAAHDDAPPEMTATAITQALDSEARVSWLIARARR